MKLKRLTLVALSMSVAGLISSPVLAATYHKHKHKHHHHRHHHHHHHRAHVSHVMHHDYKDMGAFKDGALPVVEAPRFDYYQTIYNMMSQNANRGVGYLYLDSNKPEWYNRLGFSGGAAFDAMWGNRSMGYQGENNRRLSLNDVYLNTTAVINDWARALVSLSYNNASTTNGIKLGQYSAAYNENSDTHRIDLEQAYVTLANYNEYPVFIQLGKQFTDFGRYKIHAQTRTLAQVLSESLQTSAKLGFILPMGLHGQVYAFDNSVRQFNTGHTRTVYGAALGYTQLNDQLGYDLGIGYMSNMTGVNDIGSQLTTYQHSVGALALHGDVNSGPFMIGARYVTALSRFNSADFSSTVIPVFGGGVINDTTARGARPWAADITAGYGYNAMGKNQNVYLGYQASGDAVAILIPKNRWMAGIDVEVFKNTNIGLELTRDKDYSTSKGGTGKTTGKVGLRAAVKFG